MPAARLAALLWDRVNAKPRRAITNTRPLLPVPSCAVRSSLRHDAFIPEARHLSPPSRAHPNRARRLCPMAARPPRPAMAPPPRGCTIPRQLRRLRPPPRHPLPMTAPPPSVNGRQRRLPVCVCGKCSKLRKQRCSKLCLKDVASYIMCGKFI
jgi:hypothetical protein